MSESDEHEVVRIGIGVLTATATWLNESDDDGQLLAGHIDGLIAERGERAIVEIIGGLTQVACALLFDLAAATGRSKEDILQEFAAKHQR
jgi:hypothetical protein